MHERIDAFAGAGRADLVAELTTIFPVQVIAHIVGVPPGDYARFMHWSLDLIAFSKDPARGRAASDHLHAYLLPQVRSKVLEKFACIPLPFQSRLPNGLQCQLMSMPYDSHRRIMM